MTPREHLRKMTGLGEPGTLDEKQWYRVVNGMSGGELRQRQELIMRNQMVMTPQHLTQQRLQAPPGQFEPRFMDRELVPSTEMVPSEARQLHMRASLGPSLPPHSSVVPARSFPGTGLSAGYGFLPSEPLETVARRQEMIHKQNIARMEMNAILHQKELETAHQKGLMGMEPPMIYQGIPPNAMAFRGRQRIPEGHLPSDVFVHRTTLEDLQANSLLMSASPYPPISTLQRERGRRSSRRAANHKMMDANATGAKGQSDDKGVDQSPGGSAEEKEGESKGEPENESVSKPDHVKINTELASGSGRNHKECKEGPRKNCIITQEGCADTTDSRTSTNEKDDPSTGSVFHEKFVYPSPSYIFPLSSNGFLPPGPHSFLNSEVMSSVEDLRKWTVDDVYSFINNIPSCSEYAQTFKDHMIDGETLPLLTEDHLLDTMGLKLGPALKIRSQVSRRLGSMFYAMNLPLTAGAALQHTSEKTGDQSAEISPLLNCNSMDMLGSPCPRDLESVKPQESMLGPENPPPPVLNENV
ncbi:sterile alpha motif domain-containing protein 7 [Brienomyrus brachyistius]|uniref:sterile alpha motif domain-containing protein 7 n=1 Tax=Brienomyrus brachyistius TaxID=42636 RepID=UPI0020B23582|nr:sterile alpha motif domain-containing protein 7 [Brienomyrus brachyistius]XP_048845899.1 sterile alpha motif domain-containing protein 7 [Brienomyrus brachyistius]XP_048845900.1 sterile alpha motif domain-containing protein 7 [Brienomyrus brachyistius]XP_048845901.1 sterile alpha motif domain-containing protein 7 [Brienomyrus brachyistius]XP_048845902.1 sterile alpha motif domain-containing protein 7 [Brienomyrus brachyistius]